MRSPWLVGALTAALGCGAGPMVEAPLPAPDRASFEATVGDVLARRCGAASCHGAAGRPFALFAAHQRRLPPTTTFDQAPLTPAELDANYAATRGFLNAESALETLLVRKALGQAAHGGGPVFEHRSDPECRALRAWIEGRSLP